MHFEFNILIHTTNKQPQKKDWSDYAELLKKNSEKIAKAYSDTKNSLLYNYSLKNTGNMLELYTGLRKLVQDLRESLCFNCEKKLLHLQQRKEILALEYEFICHCRENSHLINQSAWRSRH
mgnify:CR=1 FL=1